MFFVTYLKRKKERKKIPIARLTTIFYHRSIRIQSGKTLSSLFVHPRLENTFSGETRDAAFHKRVSSDFEKIRIAGKRNTL